MPQKDFIRENPFFQTDPDLPILKNDRSPKGFSGKLFPPQPESSQQTAESDFATLRIIKKYPNRRLYDTVLSTYITLNDVRQLVLDGTPFRVLDAKTRKDRTRSILLQIILEEETAAAPLLTEAVLENIIRFYGHSMQAFMGSYLEKNVQALMDMQRQLADNAPVQHPQLWEQFMHMQPPLVQEWMKSYAEQSQTVLAQLQEQMQKNNAQIFSAFGIKP